jgi:hypothetical protein
MKEILKPGINRLPVFIPLSIHINYVPSLNNAHPKLYIGKDQFT